MNRNLQSRHGQPLSKVGSKVAMANQFGGVEYSEISKVAVACHGGALTSHGPHGYIAVSMASHGQPWLRFGQNQEYWIFMPEFVQLHYKRN